MTMETAIKPSMDKEIKRKLFHMLTIFYALAYFFLDKRLTLAFLGGLLAVEAAIEICRLKLPFLNNLLLVTFGNIAREDERSGVSGIFWTLLGVILTIFLFHDQRIVLCSLGYLIAGDPAAALVGMKFGRCRFFGKSLEGSVAFFAVSLVIGLFFFKFPYAVLGAGFAAVVEILPLPFNDNFWIPVSSALFLSITL